MTTPIRPALFVLIATIAGLTSCASSGSTNNATPTTITGGSDTVGLSCPVKVEEANLQSALALWNDMNGRNRPILMIVGETWCPSCRELEKFWNGENPKYIGVYSLDGSADSQTALGRLVRELYLHLSVNQKGAIPFCTLFIPGKKPLTGIGYTECGESVLRFLQQEKGRKDRREKNPKVGT
ncbi:hypothetical protein HN481_03590 [Candidatus Parcubacteria bacterium]|jgi:hypothetical protein|nr:hypothetical protein [Candidatus Parcubacteria bacterium]